MSRAGRACALATALAFVLALAWTLPASAQTGSGLYEPFPEPAARSQAQDYLKQLLLRPVSAKELDDGRFVGALSEAPPSVSAASERAGADGSGADWLDLPVIALLAAVLLAVVGLRKRGAQAATG